MLSSLGMWKVEAGTLLLKFSLTGSHTRRRGRPVSSASQGVTMGLSPPVSFHMLRCPILLWLNQHAFSNFVKRKKKILQSDIEVQKQAIQFFLDI